jgi:hypothetical protein
MNWATGTSVFPQAKLAGPFHLLVPFPSAPEPSRRIAAEPLPDDLPDYMVYVTRHALLAGTTSLTKASTETHSFLVKLCQYLAFERFMRSVAAWWTPAASPFYMGALQPWPMATAPDPTRLPFWGASTMPAPSLPARSLSASSKPAARPAVQPSTGAASPGFPNVATDSPAYAAMMLVPALCLAFTPAVLDAWRLAV